MRFEAFERSQDSILLAIFFEVGPGQSQAGPQQRILSGQFGMDTAGLAAVGCDGVLVRFLFCLFVGRILEEESVGRYMQDGWRLDAFQFCFAGL